MKKIFKFKYILLLVVFLITLIIFFLNNKYYMPTKSVIKTTVKSNCEATLYWDSGVGFNERENTEFKPYLEKPYSNKLHTVTIKKLRTYNKQALDSQVWIKQILLDNKDVYNFKNLKKQGQVSINDSTKFLVIKNPNSSITFKSKFKNLNISFNADKWCGEAEVNIDGEKRIIDTYANRNFLKNVNFGGTYSNATAINEVKLPQLNIKRLIIKFSKPNSKVDYLRIKYGNKSINLKPTKINKTNYVYNNLNLHTDKFSFILFCVQILTSLIIVLVVYGILNYLEKLYFKYNISNFKEVFKHIFIEHKHYVFWLMLLISFSTFSLWLLGQWPAFMTVDSYHFTWREIKTLEFQNVTPWIYNIYVLMLTQLHDSPATIAIFQIMAMSVLGSYIFYYCYKNGAKKWIISICFIMYILSIPIGVYNITIWKDIPFNAIMVFLAFFVYVLYFNKKYNQKIVDFTFIQILLISVSFILLLTLRHNGLVFMVLIPILFFVLLNRKNFYQYIAISVALYAITMIITNALVGGNQIEVNQYFSKIYRVGPLAAIYSSKTYYSPSYENDEKLINKWINKNKLKEIYTPVTQADDIGYLTSRWYSLNEQDQKELNKLYFYRSLQNMHIFLADRTAMFFGTTGLSNNVAITSNELENAGNKDEWRPIESYRLQETPKSSILNQIQHKIIMGACSFRGNIPIAPLVFNTFVPLIILIIIFMLYKWFPVTALYSFVFLYNIPFLFIALSTCEWRYFYFMYVSIYFVFPLISLERRQKRI